MKRDVFTMGSSDPVDSIDLTDHIFNVDFNPDLIHQVVVSYLSSIRSGQSMQKNRSLVRGGGKKPWKQKGSGKARAGTIRSPLWKGGGRTFGGPSQKANYQHKINKRAYRLALFSVFSELLRQDRLKIFDHFQIESAKTKEFKKQMIDFENQRCFFLDDELNANFSLSARNLPWVHFSHAKSFHVIDLVNADYVLMSKAAVSVIEGIYAL